MNNDEFPDYLRKAIEDGEVTLDEQAKTARINIDVDEFDRDGGPERAAGQIIGKMYRKQGLRARLEYLGYTVES